MSFNFLALQAESHRLWSEWLICLELNRRLAMRYYETRMARVAQELHQMNQRMP
jgi:hypothetical protein